MTRKSKRKFATTSRDSGGFVAIPLQVLYSLAFTNLSHPAKALLLEVAMQFHGDDNGRMILTRKHLAPRGWKSHDVIVRATKELVDAGFIYQTVIGMRPHRAAWFAVTWRSLDKLDGYDPGAAAGFERSAYMKKTQPLARLAG